MSAEGARGPASPLLVAKTPERSRLPTPYGGLGNPLASPLPAFFSPGGGANLFSSPLPLFHPSPLSKRGAPMSPAQQQPFSPGQFNYDTIFKSPLNAGLRGDPLGTPGAEHLSDQLLWKLDTPGSKALFMGGDFLSPSPLRGVGRPGEGSSGKGKGKGAPWGQDDALLGRGPRLEGAGRGASQLPGPEDIGEEHGDELRSALASPAGKVGVPGRHAMPPVVASSLGRPRSDPGAATEGCCCQQISQRTSHTSHPARRACSSAAAIAPPRAPPRPQDISIGGRGRAQHKAPGAFKSGQSRRRCLDFGSAEGAGLRSLLGEHGGSAADLAALGLHGAGLQLRQVLPGLPLQQAAAPMSTFIPVQRTEGDAEGALGCEERLQGDEQQEERGRAAGRGPAAAAGALAAAAAAAEGAALLAEQQGQQQRGRRSSRSSRRAQPLVYDEEPEEPDTETEEWEAEQNVVRRAQRSSRRARRQVQRLVEDEAQHSAAAAAAAAVPRGAAAAQARLPHRHDAHEAGAAQQLQHQPAGGSRPQRSLARPRPEARAEGGADGTPDRRLSFASASSMSVLEPYTPDERGGPT